MKSYLYIGDLLESFLLKLDMNALCFYDDFVFVAFIHISDVYATYSKETTTYRLR